MCIKELDKINLICWFDFGIEPISDNDRPALKIPTHSKAVKSYTKISSSKFYQGSVQLYYS